VTYIAKVRSTSSTCRLSTTESAGIGHTSLTVGVVVALSSQSSTARLETVLLTTVVLETPKGTSEHTHVSHVGKGQIVVR
jgi:hypothetical protein